MRRKEIREIRTISRINIQISVHTAESGVYLFLVGIQVMCTKRCTEYLLTRECLVQCQKFE